MATKKVAEQVMCNVAHWGFFLLSYMGHTQIKFWKRIGGKGIGCHFRIQVQVVLWIITYIARGAALNSAA